MTPEDFMREAIRLGEDAMRANRGGPFGCVVARQGGIIARGENRVTSSNDPTAHAEVTAIREACRSLGVFRLDDCELYTSCEPCPMCLAASYWARLDAIYYGASAADAARAGFDDAFLYEEFRKSQAARTLPASQLLAGEAWSAFAAWIASPNKTEY